MSVPIQTDLELILSLAIEKQDQNDSFRIFLQHKEGDKIDTLVSSINQTVSQAVDCTKCGNCCKNLMIGINETEADALSAHLQQSRASFDKEYVEKGNNGMMLMNKMPCHFLSEKRCTIYNHRFSGCKQFPAMNLPNFKERLFTTFMHYNRCPIIYNVVEQLKIDTKFIES